MKRYKLLKDLPTFKAGDEFVLRNGHLYCIDPQSPEGVILAYAGTTLEKFPNILKEWFEEVPEKPKTVWDLKDGDKYCFVFPNGEIAPRIWDDSQLNYEQRDMGNAFITREEAEKEIARRKAKQILLRDTKGYKPVWGSGALNYEVYVNSVNGLLIADSCNVYSQPDLWFASKKDAEASVKAHEKEWRTYLGAED